MHGDLVIHTILVVSNYNYTIYIYIYIYIYIIIKFIYIYFLYINNDNIVLFKHRLLLRFYCTYIDMFCNMKKKNWRWLLSHVNNYWIVINGDSHKWHINYVKWYEMILLSIYATNTMHAIWNWKYNNKQRCVLPSTHSTRLSCPPESGTF